MIYEILHSGEDASVSMLELSQRLCVPERQIRKQIYRERRAGCPILSGIHGYYLPSEDPETARCQIIAFCKEQRKHAISHNETADLLAAILPQIGGTGT